MPGLSPRAAPGACGLAMYCWRRERGSPRARERQGCTLCPPSARRAMIASSSAWLDRGCEESGPKYRGTRQEQQKTRLGPARASADDARAAADSLLVGIAARTICCLGDLRLDDQVHRRLLAFRTLAVCRTRERRARRGECVNSGKSGAEAGARPSADLEGKRHMRSQPRPGNDGHASAARDARSR